jgi:hypothetical protein
MVVDLTHSSLWGRLSAEGMTRQRRVKLINGGGNSSTEGKTRIHRERLAYEEGNSLAMEKMINVVR